MESYQHLFFTFQNHKKHVAVRVKELVTPRKSPVQPNPALVGKINTNSETSSGEGGSKIYTCEGSLQDVCSVHSYLQQKVEDNNLQKNERQIVTTSSTHLSTEQEILVNNLRRNYDEQVETSDTTHLNTEQETVMKDTHRKTKHSQITSSGHEAELNDSEKNTDKGTDISNISHSNLKQEMAVQANSLQIPTANSKSDVINSEISDTTLCDPTSSVLVPQYSKLAESLPSHDSVLLQPASPNTQEESDTVSSQFDTCDAELPFSDSFLTNSVETKPNVPNMTKLEMDKLESKSETGEDGVS